MSDPGNSIGDRDGLRIKTLFIRPLAALVWKLGALGVVFRKNARHQDSTTLLDMNDDCIHEILSMKSLSAIDLCSTAETCRRLKEIARRVFRRKHKTCDLNSLSGRKAKSAKRILMHFGSEIRHLQIEGERISDEWSREMLPSVTEYCSTTLQSLDLRFFHIPETFTGTLRCLFENLQKLRIVFCTFDGDSKGLFAECGSLVELNICHCNVVPAFMLEITFPKLQRFECRRMFRSDLLASFISRHNNLKSLKIWDNSIESSVLSSIASCRRLETLACCLTGPLNFSNLNHLRELNIYSHLNNFIVNPLSLDHLKFLERLVLRRTEIELEFVRSLTQLKRLQALELWWCTGLENLNRTGDVGQLTTLRIHSNDRVDLDISLLVQRLGNLNFLRITVTVAPFEMDLEKYLRIVDVVGRRPDRSRLTFRLASNYNYDDLRHDFSLGAHLVEMIIDRFFY